MKEVVASKVCSMALYALVALCVGVGVCVCTCACVGRGAREVRAMLLLQMVGADVCSSGR